MAINRILKGQLERYNQPNDEGMDYNELDNNKEKVIVIKYDNFSGYLSQRASMSDSSKNNLDDKISYLSELEYIDKNDNSEEQNESIFYNNEEQSDYLSENDEPSEDGEHNFGEKEGLNEGQINS